MLATVLAFIGGLFNMFIDVVHSVVKSLLILVLSMVVLCVGMTIGLVALLR